MYLSGLIAGSNNQMRHCQAGTMQGFASTFGTAQRYVDFWSTLYLVVGVGKYAVLKTLPDKIARFLYEYHNEDYLSKNLPPLPIDRSDIDVHGILQGYEVCVLYKYAEYAEYVQYVYFYTRGIAQGIVMPRAEYAEYAQYSIYIFCILCIFIDL